MGYMSDDTYKVTLQLKPDGAGDPIPWRVEVEQDDLYVGGGWNATREEALERAQWIIDRDQNTGETEVLTMRPSA